MRSGTSHQGIAQVNEACRNGDASSMFPPDPLRIGTSLGLLEFHGDHSALLLSSPVDGPDLLLPPEKVACIQPEQPDHPCHGSKHCPSDDQVFRPQQPVPERNNVHVMLKCRGADL